VHERGRVTENGRQLNLRGTPSTTATIIRKLDPGVIFEVIAGPRCAEGYAWFQIRFGASEGWIAEGDAREYYVEPYQTG
jgi:SH3-like domain-containing protein